MFILFLVAAAVATSFTQLGAMSVQISVLTLALMVMSVAFLAVTIAAIKCYLANPNALHFTALAQCC